MPSRISETVDLTADNGEPIIYIDLTHDEPEEEIIEIENNEHHHHGQELTDEERAAEWEAELELERQAAIYWEEQERLFAEREEERLEEAQRLQEEEEDDDDWGQGYYFNANMQWQDIARFIIESVVTYTETAGAA